MIWCRWIILSADRLNYGVSSDMKKRVVLIVLDSLGIGALPDAKKFGDTGSNTLRSIVRSMPDFSIPNLKALGLGNIEGLTDMGISIAGPKGAYGRMAEVFKGKDTIAGHWEITGILNKTPFKTYEKFPDDFMKKFEKAIGVGTLGNYAASGTEIIEDLGPEHERTGKPIIYTSADSVFQIAANTAVIPLDRLYKICGIARKMLVGDIAVGRVIARPYIIENGKRIRTSDRKDYAVAPPENTLLDNVKDAGQDVIAIGKINDIFAGQGITKSIHTENNNDGITKTIETIKSESDGLIFTNLVDFDSKYGHRRDAVGYGKAIERFDKRLGEIEESLKDDDMLVLCADHGNDPAHTGWDHTREYVPVMIYGKMIRENVDLGTMDSFADLGATIADYLGVEKTELGKSFLKKIILI